MSLKICKVQWLGDNTKHYSGLMEISMKWGDVEKILRNITACKLNVNNVWIYTEHRNLRKLLIERQ